MLKISNFHGELRNTHNLCSKVRNGRSQLSNVVYCDYFYYFGSIPHRFSDTTTYSSLFFSHFNIIDWVTPH